MIRFKCNNCSKKLKVPKEYVNRKVKCPDCETILVVPPATEETDNSDGDLRNMLSGLDEGEAIEDERPEPKPADSEAPEPKLPKKPSPVSGVAADASRYLRAVAFGVVAAVIGAFVWAGIAKVTGYELGFVAWGIGLLTGMGVLMGGAEAGTKLGVTAAVIAICGILGGKVLVINWIYEEYAGESYASMSDDEILNMLNENEEEMFGVAILSLMDDELKNKMQNDTVDEQTEQELERISIQAVALAQTWTDQQKIDNARAGYDRLEASGELYDKAGAIKEGLKQSFGVMDIVFMGLAIATAYKMGAGINT